MPFVITSISLVAIRTNCAERRSKPLKYISIEVLISDAREAYYEAQNSTIFPPSRKDPDDHDRIHLHSPESLLPAIWEARLCDGCKAAARGAEPQHGGPLCVPGVRHLRGGFRPLGQEAPLHSGQAEPRSAFCRRSGRQAPHPGILCHAAGGRLRDPRGDRGDQRLPPPSEKTEGDDNSAEDEALARQIEEQHRERVSPFAFSKCGISEGAELEFCCRGNEQPASAAPSPTTSMCAFRTKYGPWPHWRSICWGPGIRSPGLSISNTTARG